MLVLSRKIDQSIIIGDNIEVQVTRIDGDVVKLGIQAPRSVSVHRKEVFEAIRQSNKEAASASPSAASILTSLAQKNQGSGPGGGHGKANPRKDTK